MKFIYRKHLKNTLYVSLIFLSKILFVRPWEKPFWKHKTCLEMGFSQGNTTQCLQCTLHVHDMELGFIQHFQQAQEMGTDWACTIRILWYVHYWDLKLCGIFGLGTMWTIGIGDC